MIWLTEYVVRRLQKLAHNRREPSHLKLGRHGEAEACFYLRRLGYRIIATNFRAPGDPGEVDLIGWDGDVLCFIEVKTRTDDSFAPPSTAVTKEKQKHILSVAKSYLRRLPGAARPACRFDVVSVVPSSNGRPAAITLHKGAFSRNAGRRRQPDYRERFARRFSRHSRDARNLPR